MKRNYQLIMCYTSERTGYKISKSSFNTVEKAIENAELFIYKKESWTDITVVSAKLINKETNETIWSYN